MKPETIIDAIGEINENTVAEADAVRRSVRKKHIRIARLCSMAASVGIVILCVWLLPRLAEQSIIAAEAQYPDMAPYPNEALAFANLGDLFEEQHDAWRASQEAIAPGRDYHMGMTHYLTETIGEFLGGAEGENRVFSPLSLYMALSMVAETAEGDTRAQILSLLGRDDMADSRFKANELWRGNYRNDGATTSILANSLWIDSAFPYNRDTVETVAQNYYASVYHGALTSDALQRAMRDWLNEQTGGLLRDAVKNVSIDDPNAVMTLFSTVYFRAKWMNEFNKSNNETRPFHAPTGDIEAEFMYRSYTGTYYWSEKFAAVQVPLENSGWMWFILPDEGVTTDEILAEADFYTLTLQDSAYLAPEEYPDQKGLIIHFRLPKFDVASEMNLTDGLVSLGVADAFDPVCADFSPLLENPDAYIGTTGNVSLSSAKQAARVAVDEEGVTAAAFTEMTYCGAAAPPDEEVEFTLDRPFIFALSHSEGLPLFTGIVVEP